MFLSISDIFSMYQIGQNQKNVLYPNTLTLILIVSIAIIYLTFCNQLMRNPTLNKQCLFLHSGGVAPERSLRKTAWTFVCVFFKCGLLEPFFPGFPTLPLILFCFHFHSEWWFQWQSECGNARPALQFFQVGPIFWNTIESDIDIILGITIVFHVCMQVAHALLEHGMHC